MKGMPIVISAALGGLLLAAAATAGDKLPLPPRFDGDTGRTEILEAYPLGVITKQAAFSHHGKANLEMELPNGLEGWIYTVDRSGQKKTYRIPKGKEQEVTETRHGPGTQLYTLVFSSNGKVIDVLYNEHGRHDGLSALQAQQELMERVMATDPGRGAVD